MNKRINKISRKDNVFVFEVTGDKKYLIVRPGGFYVANYAPRGKADGFCMFLRKYLTGQIIRSVRQHNVDRVIFVEFDNLTLVLELFGKLNIILIEEGKVKSQLRRSNKFGKGDEYVPPKSVNYLNLSEQKFSELVEGMNKSDIARFLGIGKMVEEMWGKGILEKLKQYANMSINPDEIEEKFKQEDTKRLVEKELDKKNAEKKKYEKTIKEMKLKIEENLKNAADYRRVGSEIFANIPYFDKKLKEARSKGKKRIKATSFDN